MWFCLLCAKANTCLNRNIWTKQWSANRLNHPVLTHLPGSKLICSGNLHLGGNTKDHNAGEFWMSRERCVWEWNASSWILNNRRSRINVYKYERTIGTYGFMVLIWGNIKLSLAMQHVQESCHRKVAIQYFLVRIIAWFSRNLPLISQVLDYFYLGGLFSIFLVCLETEI